MADIPLIERALPGLDLLIGECDRTLTDWENAAFYKGPDGEDEQALLAEQLEFYLRKLQCELGVVLEAASLPETRAELRVRFTKVAGKPHGLREVQFHPEPGVVTSEILYFLRHTVEGLRLLSGNQEQPVDSFLRERFLEILKDTGHLVHKRGVMPRNEHDIQIVMRDYLEVVFPDFVKEFDIPGVLKNFKPDGGIRRLHSAVEFKFADSQAEVSRALSGLFEDSAGYSGSDDWRVFYSVVYMTGPHESVARFKKDFRRSGLLQWTPILVQGPGGRRGRRGAAAHR